MTTRPDYESILARGREESVRQIEDIFSNPHGEILYKTLILEFESKQEHPEAIKPDVSCISINHNLANIIYALTGISCSPERIDDTTSIGGRATLVHTALAQEILVRIYTPDQKRRIAKVLKTVVRKFCEEYRDLEQETADDTHRNPQPNSDDSTHAEEMVQLQQNKIEFIDYIVRRLET